MMVSLMPEIIYLNHVLIGFAPNVSRLPANSDDIFAFVAQFRSVEELPPLKVRLDPPSGKYFIVCVGIAYQNEGILLEAAPKLGLSILPCIMASDEEASTTAFPKLTREPPQAASSIPNIVPGGTLDFNQIFSEIRQLLDGMATRVRRRTDSTVLRVTDNDDWLQECLLALWRHMLNRSCQDLADGAAVRRFASGVFANQVARAAKHAKLYRQLDVTTNLEQMFIDELVERESAYEFHENKAKLGAMLADIDQLLQEMLRNWDVVEADAAKAWLDGATTQAAADIAGSTFAKVRGLIQRLKKSKLRPHLRRARQALETLWHRWPNRVAEVDIGRVCRLLEDPL
jgi:hypothetical protein